MASKKREPRKFVVKLKSRRGEAPPDVTLVCDYMTVNHRGDLLACEGNNATSYNAPTAVAAFGTGVWESFQLAEAGNEE
jgi:hypothetical protein